MGEDEPGVAGTLADSAVRDDVAVGGDDVAVDLVELAAAPEPAVFGGGLGPRDGDGGGDVSAAQRSSSG